MNTNGDWLLAALGEIEEAAGRVRVALAGAADIVAPIRELHRGGAPLTEVALQLMQRGGDSRRRANDAFRGFQIAVDSLRSRLIRVLVDEEGVSLTQVADALGVSRQVASRLYHASPPLGPP
jgi:hypothetical protein